MKKHVNPSYLICNDFFPGCYRFSDGSFMAYLEMEETGPKMTKMNVSAPIFIENSDCEISEFIEYTFDGHDWDKLDGAPFVLEKIDEDTIALEVR